MRRCGQVNFNQQDPQKLDIAPWMDYWSSLKLDALLLNAGGIRASTDLRKLAGVAAWFNADHQGRSGITPIWDCAQQGRVAQSVMKGRTIASKYCSSTSERIVGHPETGHLAGLSPTRRTAQSRRIPRILLRKSTVAVTGARDNLILTPMPELPRLLVDADAARFDDPKPAGNRCGLKRRQQAPNQARPECPSIPGCVSQGQTEAEAESNVADAIRECLAVRADLGMSPAVTTREVEVFV